jgi:hypothetical protein
MSETLNASDQDEVFPKIGVVGHSRAGKSTFLAVLKTAFEAAGWAATIRSVEQQQQTATSSLRNPEEYVKFLRRFIEAGFFPPATRVQDTADRVSFDVMRGNNRFEIDCFDPAGEVLEGNYDERSPEAFFLAAIQKSLNECTGVLMLLDPDTHPDLWIKTWERVEPGLNRDRPPRVAICFGKADTGLRQRRFRVRDARQWVKNYPGGQELLRQIENRQLQNSWHFVSATGWINGASNTRVFVNSRTIRRTGSTVVQSRLRELVPDPAQLVDGAVEGDDSSGFRYLQHFPVFLDPLRIQSHDFRLNPITDAGPRTMVPQITGLSQQLSDELQSESAVVRDNASQRLKELRERLSKVNAVAGVHVGYGRGGAARQSTIRPWNVVEPVLWLAKLAGRSN